MQKFERHINHSEVEPACKAAGLKFDDSGYKKGSDYVSVTGNFAGTHAEVLYSSWNGKFIGETADGIRFSSDSDEHDGKPWFDSMLRFFYVAPVAA